jgi:hypothetical protein
MKIAGVNDLHPVIINGNRSGCAGHGIIPVTKRIGQRFPESAGRISGAVLAFEFVGIYFSGDGNIIF